MFDSDDLQVLATHYPEGQRTALQRFVIDNESVFEALSALLHAAATGEGSGPPQKVNLVGGPEQMDLLRGLAEENNLTVQQFRLNSGELATKVQHPERLDLAFQAIAIPQTQTLYLARGHGV